MRDGYTKAERKVLRTLVDEAYRRELDDALTDLASLFTDWRAGRLDGFALSDAIHQFHQGPARVLWSRYVDASPDVAVSCAIAEGVVKPSELTPALLAKLRIPE